MEPTGGTRGDFNLWDKLLIKGQLCWVNVLFNLLKSYSMVKITSRGICMLSIFAFSFTSIIFSLIKIKTALPNFKANKIHISPTNERECLCSTSSPAIGVTDLFNSASDIILLI